jgi:hypothetical protein
MGVEQLRLIGAVLPVAAGAVLLGIAAWALLQIRSERLRARSDRPVALVLAAIVGSLGLLAGGFAMIVAVGFASMDSPIGPPFSAYVAYLPIVVALGAAAALASLAGYALLARTPLARAALVGSLLGPAVAIALAIGVGSAAGQAGTAASDLATTQTAADLASRSSILQVTVSNLQVTTAAQGSIVTTVRLRASVHTGAEVRLETGGKTPWPQFTLFEPSGSALGGPVSAGPGILQAGSTTTYELSFVPPAAFVRPPSGITFASTYGPATPGTWSLRMDLFDTNGAQYEVTTEVVIKAGA